MATHGVPGHRGDGQALPRLSTEACGRPDGHSELPRSQGGRWRYESFLASLFSELELRPSRFDYPGRQSESWRGGGDSEGGYICTSTWKSRTGLLSHCLLYTVLNQSGHACLHSTSERERRNHSEEWPRVKQLPSLLPCTPRYEGRLC